MSVADRDEPQVCAVVLNWNGREDTLRCLASLASQREVRLHSIVVDNGSTDDSVPAVRKWHPEVRVIENGRNLGYAQGNNVGIVRALESQASHVLILNNDTVLAEDALARLIDTAAASPAVGAVAPLILYMDPPDRVWYAGAAFDPRRGRSGGMTFNGQRRSAVPSKAQRVDWASGAAVLVTRRALEEVGGLDPKLFYLYEDVDWSLRARERGFEVVFDPAAVVWHRVAASQGGKDHTPVTLYYGTRNHLAVCQRHAPFDGIRALRRELACLLVHLASGFRAEQKIGCMRASLRGWRDHRAGRLGPAGQ